MTIYDGIFPLGIGTNRFRIKGPDDGEGLERSAEIVAEALNAGASYIDVGYSYSNGMAETICKLAFRRSKSERNVAVKSSFLADSKADDALRRVDLSFSNMGIDHASYFVIWNIASYEQFEAIIRKGSLYDGAVKLKTRGLVDHICFSTHAPVDDIVRILETGVFEGVTISFSALNSAAMLPVLECASKKNVGVAVMNPLGGGVIPENSAFYSFLRHPQEASTAIAALRFVCAYPAVKIVLSGVSSIEEWRQNLGALVTQNPEPGELRILRVGKSLGQIKGFCTGCRYCDGCPKGVDIFALMQAYNTLLFPLPKRSYGRTEKRVLENIGICSVLKNTFSFTPANSENHCTGCGRCEGKCTMRLPIIKRINELYVRFEECGFSLENMTERLKQLIKGDNRIGFYPGAGYTAFVLALLHEKFASLELEISLFDSNHKLWGTFNSGIVVLPPERILEIVPQVIIISNYNYGDEIYKSIKHYEDNGIRIVKLHEPDDVPWVF